MQNLFRSNDYYWALFIGHLVIEKLLKAYYVKKFQTHALFIHDLSRLAEKSGLKPSQSQFDLLDTITTFNINARYDDYKQEFYKQCTPEFTKQWIDNIGALRLWIKEQSIQQ